MRLSSPIFLLATAASAQSALFPRDLASITGVLANVQTGLDDLDANVQAWTTDFTCLFNAYHSLLSIFDAGTQTVEASANLTLEDAVGILPSVDELKKHAESLVDGLKSKLDLFEDNHLCKVLAYEIDYPLHDRSSKLIDAIVSKILADAQEIAKDQAQGFADIIAEAKALFSPANCTDRCQTS